MKVGDKVIAKYHGRYFPGVIKAIKTKTKGKFFWKRTISIAFVYLSFNFKRTLDVEYSREEVIIIEVPVDELAVME